MVHLVFLSIDQSFSYFLTFSLASISHRNRSFQFSFAFLHRVSFSRSVSLFRQPHRIDSVSNKRTNETLMALTYTASEHTTESHRKRHKKWSRKKRKKKLERFLFTFRSVRHTLRFNWKYVIWFSRRLLHLSVDLYYHQRLCALLLCTDSIWNRTLL